MKPPIFIIGPHRAGSTLWHNLIAMCPGVMRLADPLFLGARRQRDFEFFLGTQARDLSSYEDIEKMVELCFSKKAIPGLEAAFWRFEGIEQATNPQLRSEIAQQVAKAADRGLGTIAKAIIEQITRFSGYERACVKFPVDGSHLPELLQWFPECKIVHITRDPRALAMSKSNDPSGTALRVLEHPRFAWLIRKAAVGLVIAQYRASAQNHLRFQGLDNYKLFRYEDLLAEPEGVLRQLCAFIECEFSESMLHPEKGIHDHQPSSLTGKRQKAFDPSAALRWQAAISAFESWTISLLTRRSMRNLGYDPDSHPIFRVNSEASVKRSNHASATA
jgi:hypothetical protein